MARLKCCCMYGKISTGRSMKNDYVGSVKEKNNLEGICAIRKLICQMKQSEIKNSENNE